MAKKNYHAWRAPDGRGGVFDNYPDCQSAFSGISGEKHKGFATFAEAWAFAFPGKPLPEADDRPPAVAPLPITTPPRGVSNTTSRPVPELDAEKVDRSPIGEAVREYSQKYRFAQLSEDQLRAVQAKDGRYLLFDKQEWIYIYTTFDLYVAILRLILLLQMILHVYNRSMAKPLSEFVISAIDELSAIRWGWFFPRASAIKPDIASFGAVVACGASAIAVVVELIPYCKSMIRLKVKRSWRYIMIPTIIVHREHAYKADVSHTNFRSHF